VEEAAWFRDTNADAVTWSGQGGLRLAHGRHQGPRALARVWLSSTRVIYPNSAISFLVQLLAGEFVNALLVRSVTVEFIQAITWQLIVLADCWGIFTKKDNTIVWSVVCSQSSKEVIFLHQHTTLSCFTRLSGARKERRRPKWGGWSRPRGAPLLHLPLSSVVAPLRSLPPLAILRGERGGIERTWREDRERGWIEWRGIEDDGWGPRGPHFFYYCVCQTDMWVP
jgi:hypothetical protein